MFAGEAPDGEMALPMLIEMKPDMLVGDIRNSRLWSVWSCSAVVRRNHAVVAIVADIDEFERLQLWFFCCIADVYLLKVSRRSVLKVWTVAEQIEQEQQQLLL